MPIATNPETGAVVFLGDDGQWQPARTAVNPDTKQMLAYDGKGWIDVPAKSKGVLSYIDDAVRSIANGVTFGFADELAAKADTALGTGKGKPTYEENLAAQRARDAEIPTAIKIPGEIGGAVAGGLAAAPVAGAAGAVTGLAKLPALAKTVLTGAGGGALFGAGEAEDGQRLEGAAKGGAMGAVAGAVAPKLVEGAVKVGSAVKNAFSPVANVSADLQRALTRDGMTADELFAKLADVRKEKPEATLADVGGENVRGLVERVAQTPGAGRTIVIPALTERQQNQMSRIGGDLKELTGTTQTARQAIVDTMEERATAAKPLYQEAFDFNAREHPELVKAWELATGTGWGKSILNGGPLKKNLQSEYGIKDIDAAPLMVQIDAWKKAVDDVIGNAVRSGNTNQARVMTEMKNRVIDVLDEVNPAYKAARAAWETPSKYIDAVENGKQVLSTKLSAEELAATFPKMTEAQQEAYRIGAIGAIISKMGNDPAKLGDMTKYLRSPEVRDKIAAIMPTKEAAESWAKRLDFEVGASELTGQALGNSATARRLAEQKQAEGLVGDLVADALITAGTGSPSVGMIKKVMMAGPVWLRDTLRSRADKVLGELMTNPSSTTLPKLQLAPPAPLSDTGRAAITAGATAGGVEAF